MKKTRLFARVFALMVVAMICYGATTARMIYHPTAPSSLWSIAIDQCGANEATAAAKVAEIQEKNPWTRESWRQFKTPSGGQGVWIYPLDSLDLTGLMVVKTLSNIAPTGIKNNHYDSSENLPEICPNGLLKGVRGCADTPNHSNMGWLTLLALTFLACPFLAYLYLERKRSRQRDQEHRAERERELETAKRERDAAILETKQLLQHVRFWQEVSKDPVTSGLPQVPGGIRDDEHAAQTFTEKYRHSGATLIGNPRRVRVTGTVGVCYAGSEQPLPRELNRHRCYMGNIQRGTDIRAELMMQACGNDIRFGQIMGYNLGPDVLIEEGWEDAPAETPTTVETDKTDNPPVIEPVPTPTATQPQTPVADEKPDDLILRVAVNPGVPSLGVPSLIEMIGVEQTKPYSFQISRRSVIRIRYTPAEDRPRPISL